MIQLTFYAWIRESLMDHAQDQMSDSLNGRAGDASGTAALMWYDRLDEADHSDGTVTIRAMPGQWSWVLRAVSRMIGDIEESIAGQDNPAIVAEEQATVIEWQRFAAQVREAVWAPIGGAS